MYTILTMVANYHDFLQVSNGSKPIINEAADKRRSLMLKNVMENLRKENKPLQEHTLKKIGPPVAPSFESNIPVLSIGNHDGHDAMEILERCASMGGDFNYKNRSGDTVLSKYLKTGHCNKEVVRFILDNGTDPSSVDNKGDTAIIIYITRGGYDMEILKMLLNYLPSDPKVGLSLTSHLFSISANANVVSLIVDCGHDLKSVDNSGATDLLRYTSNMAFPLISEVVNVLLMKGSDVNQYDNSGYTPLMGCLVRLRRHRDRDTPKYYDREKRKENEQKLKEIVDSINLLLNHGADVNTRSRRYGWTPLLMACTRHSNEKMIRRMIDLGANVNECTHEGYTPLMKYCGLKVIDIECIRLLISKGAETDVINTVDGASPFLVFSRRMKVEPDILRLFLSRRCNIYVKDRRGYDSFFYLDKVLGKHWRYMCSEMKDFILCRNRLSSVGSSNIFGGFLAGSSDDIFHHVCGFL